MTSQCGKGNNHLVPVLIPRDTFAAMKLLSDKALREAAYVSSSNTLMFPSTKHSATHISGWHAVSRVCAGAGVEHSVDTRRQPGASQGKALHEIRPAN